MLTHPQIRDIARRQRLRGVQVVAIRAGEHSLRIRIGAPAGAVAAAAAADGPAAPDVPGTVAIRAEALGWAVLPATLRAGDRVEAGRLLASVVFEGHAVPVSAPAAGRLAAVLVQPGQRVDYGMALFELAPEPGAA